VYIEGLIADKIKRIDATLDFLGSDRKILEFSYKDFVNFLKFKSILTDDTCFEEKLEKLSKRKRSEFDAFLTVWIAMWMKKWQERVKLIIGKQNKNEKLSETLAKAEIIWQNLEHKQELISIVEFTLIKNGEICSSELLAEHILKAELAKEEVDFSDKSQALTFLNSVIRRAHEIAKSIGPLIFVEINKGYYNSIMSKA